MNIHESALHFDSREQPRESVWAYEIAIQSPPATIWTYRNLLAVYFACNDPGYFSAHKLSEEFVEAAYERALILLDEAGDRFGGHPEIQTWLLHLRDRVEAVEVEEGEYARLARAEESPLAKLLVYLSSGRTEYVQEVHEMVRQAGGARTQWERYLHSFV